MVSEAVLGGGTGFKWQTLQVHIRTFRGFTAFSAITGGAGGDDIGPCMGSTETPGNHVIDSQNVSPATTVLTGKIVASQDFSFAQANLETWSPDHID